jgi:hypothetical protein
VASVSACVLGFVDAINAGDARKIGDLITEDHLFIDSDGSETRGWREMRQAWHQYFGMMPDYRIQVREIFCNGSTVVLVGTAAGTYAPDAVLEAKNRWSVPAAWRADVESGQIAAWQIFCNPEPIARVIKAAGQPETARPRGPGYGPPSQC